MSQILRGLTPRKLDLHYLIFHGCTAVHEVPRVGVSISKKKKACKRQEKLRKIRIIDYSYPVQEKRLTRDKKKLARATKRIRKFINFVLLFLLLPSPFDFFFFFHGQHRRHAQQMCPAAEAQNLYLSLRLFNGALNLTQKKFLSTRKFQSTTR